MRTTFIITTADQLVRKVSIQWLSGASEQVAEDRERVRNRWIRRWPPLHYCPTTTLR
ncbi:unnamed protein product [Ascophyllum nodosum]